MGDDVSDDIVGPPTPAPHGTAKFHYLKSNFFRVVSADGVWGGPTPNGRILINFFNDRGPIPREMTFAVDATGNLGDELPNLRQSKEGFVREVEVAISLDVGMAESLITWLHTMIGHIRGTTTKGATDA